MKTKKKITKKKKFVNTTLRKWKNSITPSDYPDFDTFNKHQQDIAYFSRCSNNHTDTNMFFNCTECCRTSNSVYCINCFSESDHENHHVTIIYTNQAVCDCGDPFAIRRDCWCSHHKKDPEFDIPTYEYILQFKNTISDVFSYLSISEKKSSFPQAINFISEFVNWGTFYCDLIAEVLFDGDWHDSFFGKICRTYDTISPQNFECFNNFLLRIITSKYSKRGYTKFFYELAKISMLVFTDSKFIPDFLDILEHSTQCVMDSDYIISLQKNDSIITNLLNLYADIYELPCFYDEKGFTFNNNNYHGNLLFLLLDSISHFFELPTVFNSIIHDADFIKAMARLAKKNSEIALIIRKDGEKEEFSNYLYHFHFSNLTTVYNIICDFAYHLPLITSDLKEDDNLYLNEAFQSPIKTIDQSHLKTLDQLFAILYEYLDPFLEIPEKPTLFNSMSKYIQPYDEQFTIDHPLAVLFTASAGCFSLYNNSDPEDIFLRIGFTKFEELAAIFISNLSGKYQIINDLFLKNNDSLKFFGLNYECIGASLSSLQLCFSISPDPGSLVINSTESFGFRKWLDASIDDVEECLRWTNMMTSLLRMFICLSCSDNFFDFCLSEKVVQKLIANLVFLKIPREDIIRRAKMVVFDNQKIIDKVINDLIDVKFENNKSRFYLKPEYEDLVDIFSNYLTLHEFNKLLANEIEKHKGGLFHLVPNDPPPSLEKLKEYLFTEQLRDVIKQILIMASQCNEKSTISLILTLFSLVRLILLESNDPSSIENAFITSDIINLLIKVIRQLENGTTYLLNFNNECQQRYPNIASIVKTEIQGDLKEKNKNRPKIDRSLILKQFSQAQNAFADKNSEDLSTIESAVPQSFTCAFCGESFNDDSEDTYGILSNLFNSNLLSKIEALIANDSIERYQPTYQIKVCGHWAHNHCFEEGRANPELEFQLRETIKQCPIDRTGANIIIPVFSGNEPSEKCLEVLQQFSESAFAARELSLSHCIAYNIALIEVLARQNPTAIDDKRTLLGLIHLIRASFFIDSIKAETNDPFVKFTQEFCANGNFSKAKEVFNELLPVFWNEIAKSAKIQPKEIRLSIFEAYIRRISLLEQIALSPNLAIMLPTITEFVESHDLSSPSIAMQNVTVDLENVSFLAPCLKYEMIKLKENYTDYFLQPKYYDYFKNPHLDFCLCLLCGKLCYIQKYPPLQTPNEPEGGELLYNHIMKCSCLSCGPFMFLTGEYASAIRVYDSDFDYQWLDYGSFYVDKYGDYNIGLQKGEILHLDKHKQTVFIEEMLTGEIRRKFEQQEVPYFTVD
ncbi:hypothetical protein TRFO_15189 [Tritrichomonas foetus]|uniref:E3 ubiquitin-protein ligase n=1 Tax=Tritrichomonas foetus TaxID=1144522 RepID=A0A1J4KXI2_9EUKA|nr:hypothetical protein TRFO_15189 [Tritrichomonas foetus]|eukprot:OHT14412.1 hypothetical protein TRFO_15189 [Tritrichomonas foetus]